MHPRVRAGRKNPGDVSMTVGARFVADKGGPFNRGWHDHRAEATEAVLRSREYL